MTLKDIEYTDGRPGISPLTGYIESELRPLDTDDEADYLAEKCGVSAGDAIDFLCCRDMAYTSCRSDAEFILCDIRSEIENGMFFGSGTEPDPDTICSMLYHSSLHRLESIREEEQFRHFFPTVGSLEEMYKTGSGCMCDD